MRESIYCLVRLVVWVGIAEERWVVNCQASCWVEGSGPPNSLHRVKSNIDDARHVKVQRVTVFQLTYNNYGAVIRMENP
jgi:hypothetical protein